MSTARARALTALLVVASLAVVAAAVASYTRNPADRRASASETTGSTTTEPPTSVPAAAPAPVLPAPTTTPPTTTAPPAPVPVVLDSLDIAPDGDDVYLPAAVAGPDGRPTALEVAAPATNTGNGKRTIYWETGRPPSADQQACATWKGPNDGLQQGFAFRVHRVGDGWRLITVTKNILFGAVWQFNVHLWDTTQEKRFLLHDAVIVLDLLSLDPPPYPWHVCAQVVGDRIDVKVWRAGQDEPIWANDWQGGHVVLPPGWDAPGQVGWFAGHVPPGRTGHFEDLEAGPAIGGIEGVSE